MNQDSLDAMIAEAVERIRTESGSLGQDQVVERVLEDPRIKILLDGYNMHDRSEGLEGVIIRDIRHKTLEYLQDHPLR